MAGSFRHWAGVLVVMLTFALLAVAEDDPGLTVGSPAPKLDHLLSWVQGRPHRTFEHGQVYVVEFWGTWCGPCVGSIEHLNALSERFRGQGLTVIGIAASERGETVEEKLKNVVTFLEDPTKPKANYVLAVDPYETSWSNWMEPSGSSGIPTAFIVDQKGLVVYVGHPMDIDNALEQVFNNTWDRTVARKAHLEEYRKNRAFTKAIEGLVAAKNGSLEEQLAAADAALELSPDYLGFRLSRLETLWKLGQLEAAWEENVRCLGDEAGLVERTLATEQYVEAGMPEHPQAQAQLQALLAELPKAVENATEKSLVVYGGRFLLTFALQQKDLTAARKWAHFLKTHGYLGKNQEEQLASLEQSLTGECDGDSCSISTSCPKAVETQAIKPAKRVAKKVAPPKKKPRGPKKKK